MILAMLFGCNSVSPTKTSDSMSSSNITSSEVVSTGSSTLENSNGVSSDASISESSNNSIIASTGNSNITNSITKSNISGSSTISVPKSDPLEGYKKNTFFPLGNDIMPIGAWVAPPPANYAGLGNPNYITNENYKTIKDSGLNFIQAIYERGDLNIDDVLIALDFAAANGIKYLVRDNQVSAGIDDPELMNDALNRYKNKPAFLGNMMFDEPATPAMNDLAACYKNYKLALPNALFYINLLPTYASKNQLFIRNTDGGGGVASDNDYKNYLQTYVSKVNPKFISYDYYPCEGQTPNLTPNYFKNMSFVRQTALQRNIPFWLFIQNCSFGGVSRNPNRQEIEWQVNTALAYGAKGIQYFTYWSPIESADFSSGMVSKTGEKTQTYYTIQTMNKQIKAIDAVLMNSTSVGVVVSGSSPVPVPQSDIISGYRELKSVSSSSPAIIGCFNNAGKSAYYVVNNSLTQNANVTLKFASALNTAVIQNATSVSKSGSQITLTLNPGEGALVRIQ